MKKAVVIGSGIAGMAAALRLKKQDYEVIVIESSDKVGGKVDVVEEGGYRWDAGPSLFTMPHLVDELFELFDEDASEHFTYQRKETVCNYFWEDGTRFSANQSPDKFANEASETFNVRAETIKQYLQKSAQKYALTAPVFLDQSLHKWSNYLSGKVFSALFQANKLDINKSLHQLNREVFHDDKLIQMFDRFATYNGSSPYQTPGIMSMIPTLEMQFGTYFPKGGMRSIVESLYELAHRNGIAFKLGEKALKIEHNHSEVIGVLTEKSSYEADVVVSNSDVYFTYKNLLSNIKVPKKVVEQERSSSALIFYWGMKKQFSALDLHNIFFSSNYEEEFEALFSQKKLAEDLTIYVNISSKEESNHAPEGCENWFVMVNAPYDNGQDWQSIKKKAKTNIIKKLNRILDVNIEPLIEVEEVLDPIKIESKTNSYKGSLYGTSSNSKMAAFLRHSNFSKQFKNLYFCGGSVHPGGGIPLCFKSAKIVADLIAKS